MGADGPTTTADDERLRPGRSAFSAVVDAKSPWTCRHSGRASAIVMGLAASLGGESEPLSDLHRAALLHDIDTLAIFEPDPRQAGKLTRAEFATVREHPVMTEPVLERSLLRHLARLAGS